MSETYLYRAVDRSGQAVNGTIEAEGINTAADRLREKGYFIKELKAKNQASSLLNKQVSFTRVGMKDLAIFSRQFSTMLNAGIPVMGALNILAKQVANPMVKQAVIDMVRDLEGGKTLSGAMTMHPKVFPPLMINMVEAGEMGGILEQVFERLSSYYQREYELRAKVVSAMIYPAVVMFVAILVVSIIILYVLPSFTSLFNDMGAALPLPTKILMSISELAREYFLICAGVSIAIVLLIVRFFRTDQGKQIWDKITLAVPLFGDITRKVLTSRFARTLGSLLSTGVPVLQALDMVKKLVGNYYLSQAIGRAQIALREGHSMSQPLHHANVFDPMVVQMIAIGEETGAVDKMLEKISTVYDQEVEQSVNRLTSLIEPIIIVFLAVVVGLIAVSVIVPMFEIMQRIE